MAFLDLNESSGENFDEIEPAEGGANQPDPGEYRFRVDEVSDEPAKKTGNPMVTYTVSVVANADGTPNPEQEGRMTWHRFFPVPDKNKGKRGLFGLRRYKQFLNAIGEGRSAFEVEEHMGAEFIGTVYHEKSNDEDENGNPIERTNARIIKERPVDDGNGIQAGADAEEPIEEEQQAPPQRQQAKPAPRQQQAAPAKGAPAKNGAKGAPPPQKPPQRPQMRR